jgi:hypothetical protein
LFNTHICQVVLFWLLVLTIILFCNLFLYGMSLSRFLFVLSNKTYQHTQNSNT